MLCLTDTSLYIYTYESKSKYKSSLLINMDTEEKPYLNIVIHLYKSSGLNCDILGYNSM